MWNESWSVYEGSRSFESWTCSWSVLRSRSFECRLLSKGQINLFEGTMSKVDVRVRAMVRGVGWMAFDQVISRE